MVNMIKENNVGGVKVEDLIEKDRIEKIVKRNRDGGEEIVS